MLLSGKMFLFSTLSTMGRKTSRSMISDLNLMISWMRVTIMMMEKKQLCMTTKVDAVVECLLIFGRVLSFRFLFPSYEELGSCKARVSVQHRQNLF
jgi:hypothetical protein